MAQITHAERITAQEYVKLYPETTQPMELINGEVIMSPAPTPLHQDIIVSLTTILQTVIAADKLGKLQIAPSDLQLDDYNTVQPDLYFIAADNQKCHIGEDGYYQGAPDLCIEVISRGSARRDRITKFNLYAKHGVREYWIVQPTERLIEVYTLAGDAFQRHAVYGDGDTLTSPVIPQLNLNVSDVFPPDENQGDAS